MARVRSSNGGAFAWALVIFGCWAVIATLVAIIIYTNNEKVNTDRDAAIAAREAVVSSADSAAAEGYRQDGKTIFEVMHTELLDLNVKFKSQQATIERLSTKVNLSAAELQQGTATVARRDEEMADQQGRFETELQVAATRSRGLEGDIITLTRERDELAAQVRREIGDADQAAQARIQQLNSQLSTAQNELNATNRQISDLGKRLRVCEEKLRATVVSQDVTTADGEILSIFNNGNQMFIDRGRKQGVMLGLTFEVFGPTDVIRLSTTGAARGKATIEVYDLQDDMAACRLVRVDRGATIAPGDIVANIVYDPNKTYLFFPFGDFDIEGDGGDNDINRIRNLVTEWGGELAELTESEDGMPALTPAIDYIILGSEPIFPDELSPDTIDPESIRQWQTDVRKFEAYQKIKDEALRLRVPILNQNRFIDLTGYYER